MRTLLAPFVVCALWLAAAGGAAQSAPPAGYTQLVERALAEFDAQNYFEARSLFTRAHALYPNARTLRGLGVVEFALRNYQLATDYLTKALASRERPLAGELRASTEKLLSQSREFLAEVTVRMEPEDARLLVDGEPAAIDSGKPLVLEVGDHVLEAQAAGHLSERRTLHIQGGETLQLAFALHATDDAEAATAPTELPPQPSAAPQPEPAAAAHDAGPWPWVVVGTGAALLVTGGVLAILGENDIAKVEDPKQGTPWSELKAAHDRGPMLATTGFVLAGVGAAAITTGLLWKLVWSKDEPATTRVAIGPTGAAIAGRF